MKEALFNHYKIKSIKCDDLFFLGLKNYMVMEAGQIWTGKLNMVLAAIQSFEMI